MKFGHLMTAAAACLLAASVAQAQTATGTHAPPAGDGRDAGQPRQGRDIRPGGGQQRAAEHGDGEAAVQEQPRRGTVGGDRRAWRVGGEGRGERQDVVAPAAFAPVVAPAPCRQHDAAVELIDGRGAGLNALPCPPVRTLDDDEDASLAGGIFHIRCILPLRSAALEMLSKTILVPSVSVMSSEPLLTTSEAIASDMVPP